jgi:hypothetical protein
MSVTPEGTVKVPGPVVVNICTTYPGLCAVVPEATFKCPVSSIVVFFKFAIY